jgi:hypothetical protein
MILTQIIIQQQSHENHNIEAVEDLDRGSYENLLQVVLRFLLNSNANLLVRFYLTEVLLVRKDVQRIQSFMEVERDYVGQLVDCFLRGLLVALVFYLID